MASQYDVELEDETLDQARTVQDEDDDPDALAGEVVDVNLDEED